MSQPRHLNRGKWARLRLKTRHSAAHRASSTTLQPTDSDEHLEVCVPALAQRIDTQDLTKELEALLAASATSAASHERRPAGGLRTRGR